MVRHKTRWLLVHLDFGTDIQDRKRGELSDKQQLQLYELTTGSQKQSSTKFPGKNDLIRAIREAVILTGGTAASGAASDTHVRFCDSTTRLVLLRMPREFCDLVRASLTLMTTLEDDARDRRRVVLSTVSVHGGARTAKMGLIKEIRKFYRIFADELARQKTLETKQGDRLCRAMEETIASVIQTIDF